MKPFFLRGRSALPVIRQAENAECGLACVAMVAGYFGFQNTLSALRREFPISGAGATLKEVLGIAEKLNLTARPVKFEMTELKQLQLPAILHWDMNHFVVLKKVGGKKAVIHDPAVGSRTYSLQELDTHVTGIAVELQPNGKFVKEDRREINKFSDLYQPVPGFYRSIAMVLVLSLLLEFTVLITPFYLTVVLDSGLSRRDPDWNVVVALFFLMIFVSKAVIAVARGFSVMYLTNQVGFQMASNVFHHMIRLPLEFFEKRDLGDVLSRFGSIEKITGLLTRDLVTAIVDGIFSITALLVLYWLSPFLATLAVSFMALFVGIRMLLQQQLKENNNNELQETAAHNSNIIENLRGMEAIKLSCNEQKRFSIWQGFYGRVINAGVKVQRLKITTEGLQALIFGVDHVTTVYFANSMFSQQAMTIGQFMAFVFLKQQFMSSIAQLIPSFFELKLTKLHLSRIADITFERPELDRLTTVDIGKHIQGGLSARNLTFSYPGTTRLIFENFDLEISPGTIVAVRGRSGSGKSTLLKLLTSLLRPTSGEICVDGVDLDSFGIPGYRARVAAVLQRTKILSGSIIYNIALDDSAVDLARVEAVARFVAVHDEIAALPMGYRTLLTDAGNILSSGQTQRILIARALYSQPKILFLDEALTNLDEDVAQNILRQIATQGITVVLVSRNPNILAMAQQVIDLGANADDSGRHGVRERLEQFKERREQRLARRTARLENR